MFRLKNKLLPDVPVFGFIGPIPANFGGRTGACLHRISIFADLDQREIEILNVSPAHAVDIDDVNTGLHSDGRLSERVRLRNIWHELRHLPEDDLEDFARNGTEDPLTEDPCLPSDESFVSKRRSSNGGLLQTDWFRVDGSRAISDRHDIEIPGKRSGRAVSVYNRQGTPIGRSPSLPEFYKTWFRWIFADRNSILVSDTPAYPFVRELRSETVTVIQALHSTHSNSPRSKCAKLSKKNYDVLINMHSYDRIAILTEAQMNDLASLNIGTDNMVVLPNMVKKADAERPKDTPPTSGAILSRLTTSKRIDHAIRAINQAAECVPELTLDIYGGDIDAEDELNFLIHELGIEQNVKLRGYDPHAKQRFRTSSFTLLTSISEGQGMVLLEAMAAGCIPIAYDIDYGPADIITHGVNGFLVPNGDIEVLGETIAHVATLPKRDANRMRKAAIRRARDFSPSNLTARWGQVMRSALEDKRQDVSVGGKSRLKHIENSSAEHTFTLSVPGLKDLSPEHIFLSWKSRDPDATIFGREPCTAERAVKLSCTLTPDRLLLGDDTIIDFYIDIIINTHLHRKRIRTSPDEVPADNDPRVEYYTTNGGYLSARIPGSH